VTLITVFWILVGISFMVSIAILWYGIKGPQRWLQIRNWTKL